MEAADSRNRVFFGQLESLRGIAAMSVLTFHVFASVAVKPTAFTDLGVVGGTFSFLLPGLFNGSGAVTLFFVLSGFVLGCNIDAARAITVSGYTGFIVRRLFRIVPALWLSVLGAMFLSVSLQGQHYSLHQTFNFLFLQDTSINGPLWSIQVELLASIIYPFLLYASRSLGLLFNLTLLLVLIWFSLGETPFPLRYVWCFHLGILMPMLGRPLMENLPRGLHLPLLVLAFIAFDATTQFARIEYLNPKKSIQVEGWTAFYFVAFVLYSGNGVKDAILNAAPIRWIGRISYSLYVLHFPIDSLVMWKLSGYFGSAFTTHYPFVQFLALPFVAGISLVVADLSYRFVEKPFHSYGRPMSRWISDQLTGLGTLIVTYRGEAMLKRFDPLTLAMVMATVGGAFVFCYLVFTAALRF